MEVELFRIILAFICGYFLTVAGSLTQLVTHNDLASPSTLGFNGAAVLGVLISQTLLNFDFVDMNIGPLSFLVTVIIAVTLFFVWKIWACSQAISVWGQSSLKNIILLGLSFNLFIAAIFSVVQFLFISLNYEFPSGLWFGSFKQYEKADVYLFAVVFLLCWAWLRSNYKKVALLNLGDHFSLNLKVNIQHFRQLALALAFLLSSLVISYYGVFSFLGLVFPHILRKLPWFKKNIAKELTLGPLLGGGVFSLLDLLCFNFNFYGAEFPVGLVASVAGAITLMVLIGNSQQYSR